MLSVCSSTVKTPLKPLPQPVILNYPAMTDFLELT